MAWGLIRTARGDERDVSEALDAKGFSAYAPQFFETRILRGRKITAPAYLFPGYLFVRINAAWKDVQSIRAVKQLYVQDDFPIPIRDEEIARIRLWEGKDGFVRLKSRNSFPLGSKVRVTKGPLLGHVGLYEGQDEREREIVLFAMLGRVTPVAFPSGSLVSA